MNSKSGNVWLLPTPRCIVYAGRAACVTTNAPFGSKRYVPTMYGTAGLAAKQPDLQDSPINSEKKQANYGPMHACSAIGLQETSTMHKQKQAGPAAHSAERLTCLSCGTAFAAAAAAFPGWATVSRTLPPGTTSIGRNLPFTGASSSHTIMAALCSLLCRTRQGDKAVHGNQTSTQTSSQGMQNKAAACYQHHKLVAASSACTHAYARRACQLHQAACCSWCG